METAYDLFIDNERGRSPRPERFPTINPFTPREGARIPQASHDQVADAIAAARGAFNSTWSKTSGLARAQLLNKLADLLQERAERMSVLETTDNGKVIRETYSQMHFSARAYRFFAGCADKIF